MTTQQYSKWWAIYTNLPAEGIVRIPHTWSRDSQGQETCSAPSADNQTRSYDTECSNHHPSPLTLSSKGLSRSKMKLWAIYTNLPINAIVTLPYPRSENSQGQETFSASSADNQTRNYDTESSDHPLLINTKFKGIEPLAEWNGELYLQI